MIGMLSMQVGPVRCDSVSFKSEESSFNSGVFLSFLLREKFLSIPSIRVLHVQNF